jgi:hypothetical protein
MTDQRSSFKSFTPVSNGSWTVRGIGSSRLFVRGHGSVDFLTTVNGTKRNFTVEHVLYVPGLGTNLLSIAVVTDVGLSVLFIETRVAFSKNQTTLMVGERIGKSLYHLAISPKLSSNKESRHSACLAVPYFHGNLASTIGAYKLQEDLKNGKKWSS